MTAREAAEPVDEQPADARAWDAFWAEVQGEGRTETIRGVTVPVPSDLPLGFKARMDQLRDSDRDEDVQELVGMVFGPGVLDQWITAGMGMREFQTVLTWGMSCGGGNPITFREAYELVAGAEGKSPGPSRATRRAATKKPSSPTGGASKRTSSASTSSGRKASRA